MMLWQMVQNYAARIDAVRGQDLMRTILLSDRSIAMRHLFFQRCITFNDGTALIFGKVDLSSYLLDFKAPKLNGRTNIVFRIVLTFEHQFSNPPRVSVTGNILNRGVMQMQEQRLMLQISDVKVRGCEVTAEYIEATTELEGLYVNWMVIGAISANCFKVFK